MKRKKSKLPFPEYIPPVKELGQRSKSSVWWTKSLSTYKTDKHDPNWVYMYAKTNVSELENIKEDVAVDYTDEVVDNIVEKFPFPEVSPKSPKSPKQTMNQSSSTTKNRPRDAESFESTFSGISCVSGVSGVSEISETLDNPDNITDVAVVIYDRYPKAKFHLLVLPLLVGANNPGEFKRGHLPMLKGVHNLAKMIAKHLEMEYGAGPFSIGYHAKPSMDDLHIHIVSQDFDSEYIKNKGHYNSFVNKDFFVTVDRAERDLRKYGYIKIKKDVKDLLKGPLKCHVCSKPIIRKPGMKILQGHLKEHLDNIQMSKAVEKRLGKNSTTPPGFGFD
jgi:diadenosine tetraphosphate (Ap4A) HIT family hydrolase